MGGHAETLGETLQIVRGAFVAEDCSQRVVGIVGAGQGGHDVGERLADIVEICGPELAHIFQPARCRELAAESPCRSCHDAGAPACHQGVGVKHRHALIADILGCETLRLCNDAADAGDALLGADGSFGLACGARGEQQQIGRGRVDFHIGRGHAAIGLQGFCPSLRIRVKDADAWDALRHRLQQIQIAALGYDHLAFGVSDIAHQLAAPTCGVDARYHSPAKRCRSQGRRKMRAVVEQNAHMERVDLVCFVLAAASSVRSASLSVFPNGIPDHI